MSPTHFCTSSYCFRYIYKLKIFDVQKVDQGHMSTIFAMPRFDDKCRNLQMSPKHFCVNSYCFKDLKFFFLPSRSRSRSCTLIAMIPFNNKCQNLQETSTNFVALALTVSEILF